MPSSSRNGSQCTMLMINLLSSWAQPTASRACFVSAPFSTVRATDKAASINRLKRSRYTGRAELGPEQRAQRLRAGRGRRGVFRVRHADTRVPALACKSLERRPCNREPSTNEAKLPCAG